MLYYYLIKYEPEKRNSTKFCNECMYILKLFLPAGIKRHILGFNLKLISNVGNLGKAVSSESVKRFIRK